MTSGRQPARAGAERPGPPGRRLVLGIGNADRGDDGVGLVVAGLLRGHADQGVEIFESRGDPAELLAVWAGADAVWLIDAISTGASPGTVLRRDLDAEPLPTTLPLRGLSSHGFGAAAAIELARALGELPPRFVLFGIEVGEVAVAARLSPPVAAAARQAARRILAELRESS